MLVKRILVPTGFEEASINALEVARVIAKVNGSQIDFLHIVEIPMAARLNDRGEYESEKSSGKSFLEQIQSAAKKRLEKIINSFPKDIHVKPVIKLEKDPKNIENIITQDLYDLVIVGGHVHPVKRKLILDTSHERFIQSARCPVLSVNKKTENFNPKKILVPTDFSGNIRKVAEDIRSLQKLFDAAVEFVYINTPPNFKTTSKTNEFFDLFIKEHKFDRCKCTVYNHDHIESGILTYADSGNFNLIVMLSDQENKLQRLLQGDLVDGVVNHSTLPVLTFALKSRI